MILIRHIFIPIVIIVFFWPVSYSNTSPVSDWREVEKLAEEHPYIVAVLDARNEYLCTGFSITEQTVVTAGSCLETPPATVAVSAVLGYDVVGKNILRVSHTTRHSGFSCYVSQTQPSETIMNSNVGLIFVVDKKLDFFVNLATIGDFGPLQLRKQKLEVVGFGELNVGSVVLQQQEYVQKTCVNPQWYYCICGVESSRESTYEKKFGEGGPVVVGSKVVAIASAPCGALMIPNTEVKYNIFTVIMQYYPWIRSYRNEVNITNFQSDLKSLQSNCSCTGEVILAYIVTLLIISNLIK